MGILALIAEFENDIRRERGIKGALAHLMSWNVRFGSLADIRAWIRHVRFTLKSGHAQSGHQCQLGAMNGHSHGVVAQ